MATQTTEDKGGHPVTSIVLEAGEKVAVCRCWGSKNFPFCDGTHRQIEGKGPAVVAAPEKPQEKPAA